MRFLLLFLSLSCCVSGGASHINSIPSILKDPHQQSLHRKGRITFNEEANQTYAFEVRRYKKPWDWLLYLIEDTETKMPSYFKGVFYTAVGVFSLQHMLYNPIWWCQLLAGRACYVFTKRLCDLFGARLSEDAEPPK